MWTFLNNDFVLASEAKLPVTDLSVQRGYAVFDYLRAWNERLLFADEHLERFFNSAKHMRLEVPADAKKLKEIMSELARRNSIGSSGIRITLTGGDSPDGYSITKPQLVVTQTPLTMPGPEQLARGISLASFEYQRQLPHVKTIDYLHAIWLKPYLEEQAADDVLYHSNGIISECPRTNFFLVTQDGVLATPGQNILKGITRGNVLALAEKICRVEIRDVRLEELAHAREAFVTSTTRQIMPVFGVDRYRLPHQNPLTTQLIRNLETLTTTMFGQLAE
ncbi:MAG TPA: aminotransferase class IV [Flavisolibacter sp.]|jgi:D-alanine transaminase/branched-chain amino acid aminotransferase